MLEVVLNKDERKESTKESLDALVKEGARRMLEEALLAEVSDYIESNKAEVDESGKRLVVRNGFAKPRGLLTTSGKLEIESPRINDKRAGEKFVSSLLPPFLRTSPKIESLIPALYLSGVSTGKFDGILKEHFNQSMSPATVTKLKKKWESEFTMWRSSPITDPIVYLWADGVHLKIRIGDQKKLALLVVMGVTDKGKKVLLAVEPGYRESKESWLGVLRRLENRGMTAPLLAVADGAAGFWSALRELEHYKNTKEQRCWVHKIKNVLDKCPKSLQPNVKSQLHEMMRAPDEETSTKVKNNFVKAYEDKYPKMTTCLTKNWEELMTFYSMPAASWMSLRTTNPIESSFSSVKLRMKTQRGSGSENAASAMAFKLLKECEKKWKSIKGYKEITNLLNGLEYKDGVLVEEKSLGHQGVA
jgi:transposase-like protein